VRVPTTVRRGSARVTLSFDAWKEGKVAPSTYELDVIAPKSKLVLEEVSSRWKGSLVHPNREAMLTGIRYSADGQRLIAGDYPGGVIQTWEVETGRQLTTIETLSGYRSSDKYFFLSPDWKTLYVSRAKRKPTKIEKAGKSLYRWEFEGETRAWDLATGAIQKTYRRTPMRGIRWMTMSPDGSTVLAVEELPGESERGPQMVCSLVDVQSGEFRELGNRDERLLFGGDFAADSRTIPLTAVDADLNELAIRLYDVATGEMKRSIPVDERRSLYETALSPDGKILVASDYVTPGRANAKQRNAQLRFWNADTGDPLASFSLGEKESLFDVLIFSPHGRVLAASACWGPDVKLLLFDVPRQKLAHTVVLSDEKAITRAPVFSPDGRWIAVATQVFPEEAGDREPSADDVSQPRIHLVEAATGAVRETLVAPQGFTASLCFSPDGKTLATGGYGRVDLWDVETISISASEPK
jgi:WD40 repeat protein